MAKTYYTVLTTYGSQLFAQAMANRQPVQITHFAVGDGNGRAVQPDSARTSLVRQVHRANISAVSPDPRNNKQVIFELTIPENIGGFWIREMGIYDANNRLVAYANCPDTYKPQLSEGSGKVQVMRMILLVSSSQAVTLTVDDTVIFATRGQLTPKTITATSQNGVDDTGHTHAIAHGNTTQKGIVQTTSDTGLDSEELAFNAKGAKKLAQQIARNQQEIAGLKGNKVDKTAISDSVSSSSRTHVGSSFAVKTAYDKAVDALNVANSKLGPIGTYTGNTSSLYGQNIIFDVRDNNNLGLPSEAYPWGVGLSLSSSNGGKALLYIAHNASQVWAKGVYGTDDSQPWRRIDGTDWGTIRNPVYASTTLRGLAQYSDAINLDSSEFAASAKAVKLLNDKKVDKLIEQTLDLKNLRQDKWYPVILKLPNMRKLNYFEVRTTLGDGNTPIWANHGAGISLFCQWDTQHSGWGTYDIDVGMRDIKKFEYRHCNQSPMLKIGQLFQSGYEYFYLRGGASYTLYREAGVAVEIATSPNGYHWQNEDGQYRQHLPLIESYDESLVPKTSRQALQEAIDTKATKATTLAGYGIENFATTSLTTQHLNDVQTVGMYGQAQNDNATTERNYPVQEAGGLQVLPSAYGRMQIYTTFDSKQMYVRNHAWNSGWDSWKRIDGGHFIASAMPSSTHHRTLSKDGIYALGQGGQGFPDSDAYRVLNLAGTSEGWRHQLAFRAYSNEVYISAQSAYGSDNWLPWERLARMRDLVPTRRDYSRTIRGTVSGQTGNQMEVVGSVHIHPDGRIVQILHLKHFRDFWFELEDGAVGYRDGARGYQIPLQLWTAMPNKVLLVQPQLMRSTHPTSSVTYAGGEAGEHICAWDLRKQGASRDRVTINMSRFRGSESEHIDMYVVVEGY